MIPKRSRLDRFLLENVRNRNTGINRAMSPIFLRLKFCTLVNSKFYNAVVAVTNGDIYKIMIMGGCAT